MKRNDGNMSKKQKILFRAVAVLLCFCIISTILPPDVTFARRAGKPEVSVYYKEEAITDLQIASTERVELSAACTTSESCTWQWQVLVDVKTNLWVDIYDGTGETIHVSQALLTQVLDGAGSAYLRVKASFEDYDVTSDPVCVTIKRVEGFDSEQTPVNAMGVGSASEASLGAEESLILVKVNYLDAVSGLPIYTSFTAQIDRGTAHDQTVTSPTYLGYKPYYNADNLEETDPSKCSDEADTIELHVPEGYPGSTYTINVYYKALKVSYAAKYFFQNIEDDEYTENTSYYKVGTAEAGTIATDRELGVAAKGFSKLYHYPEMIAGDGSTVFECYYDRNYSMLKFELDGGYGVEPIYARYETPILVGEPYRAGYTFKGWVLMDEEGNHGNTYVQVPDRIPVTSQTYKAVWEKTDTSYSIVYWLQNADDDAYSYIGTEIRVANSGDVITASDTLRSDVPICGYRETKSTQVRNGHTHNEACYVNGFKHYLYDEKKTKAENATVTVKGDGSTILNIYYTRQYYTLRFVYAKEYNPDFNTTNPGAYSDSAGYSIVGKSTYGFGNKKSQGQWPNGTGADYTLQELMQSLQRYDGGGDKWGKILEEPKLKTSQYTTGTIPEEGKGVNDGNYDINGDRYFYFDLTARYGADLSVLWPVDVFEQIKVPAHSQAKDALGEGEWGNYAYLAGWNGEYKVNYSLQKENSTVKGFYQKLDEGLLFGSIDIGTEGTKVFSYTADTKTERQITTTATVSGETVSSYLNYYLAFFNNGADIGWNVPREWRYEYYVPVLDGVLTEAQQAEIKESKDPVTYGNNLTYYYYATNDVIYQLGVKLVTSDNNRTAADQTQCSLVGYDFAGPMGGGLTDQCSRAEKIYNGILPDKRESYTLRMFYTRQIYELNLYNYNGSWRNYPSVPYESYLDQYVYEVGQYVEPDYPAGLEADAYSFGGWYTSPDCFQGTEYKTGTRMPDSNESVYAKWVPNTYTVNLFYSYEEMQAYEAGDTSIQPIETRQISHGAVFGSVADPSKTDFAFSGWFYTKDGKKTAYTPLDLPIKSDLNVYAEWDSRSAQPYRIYYALDQKETEQDWLAALTKAVGAAPRDNHSYTVTVGTVTRSYVYLADDAGYHLEISSSLSGYAYQGNVRSFFPKTGAPFNQLSGEYQEGYYPTASTHAMSIVYEEDKDDPVHNVYTFRYAHLGEVEYRVEYRYRESNELIQEEGIGDDGSGIAVKKTSLGVVTERFLPVTDYIADAFYKRLVLAVEKNEAGEYVGAKENVITFYYTQNSANTYYAVHYMLEDPEGGTYTESSSVTEGVAQIGNEISIVPPVYDGFAVRDEATSKSGTTETTVSRMEDGFPFQVSAAGTDLYIYYTRNTQTYAVYYLKEGTDITDLSKIPEESMLQETVTGSGKYGTCLTFSAPEIANYNCTVSGTRSMVLGSNNQENYIVFFYVPLSYVLQYQPWQLGGGSFDVTLETGTGGFKGSTPKADTGYVFAGWYLDAEGTIPVDPVQHLIDEVTGKLKPTLSYLKAQPQVNTFYAKFMPAFGQIKITRRNAADEGDGTQVFVYTITSKSDPTFRLSVTVEGGKSLTIKDLPIGEYTIVQEGDWSWRYTDESQTVTVAENQTTVAVFEAAATHEHWLSGNSKILKNRKAKE